MSRQLLSDSIGGGKIGSLPHNQKIKMKAITKILSILFPFKELNGKPSVFIQETWLEKNTRPLQVKDYLWHPSRI
jgi:hypothetical protein